MLEGFNQSWVLFAHGTIVVVPDASGDLAEVATQFLRKNGRVVVGTPLGDFGVTTIKQCPGWVVTSHHDHLVTYVAPEELRDCASLEETWAPGEGFFQEGKEANQGDPVIGLLGRTKRAKDAEATCVIHIEDKRKKVSK